MREFSKISPAVWRSKRFFTLPSDDAKFAYLYLLTCEHQNSAGAFRLPTGYAVEDLGWTPERFLAAIEGLTNAGMVLRDEETAEMVIANWFKHNPPMNPKHRIGIVQTLERLESADLHETALERLEEVSPDPDAEPVNNETGEVINYPIKRPSDYSLAEIEETYSKKRVRS